MSPLVGYLYDLSWNFFQELIDRSSAVRLIISLVKNIDLDLKKYIKIRCSVLKVLIQLVLYIYEDGDEVAPKEFDLIVFNTILAENSTSIELIAIKGLCLEYLSRVPHSANLLKLPLANLFI